MAITYPVPPESRFTVFDTDANAVIARNKKWPREDGMEIQGQADNIVYLLESTDAKPDFDSRLFRLEQNETLDIEANTAHKSWQTIERDIAEKKVALANKEIEELGRHISIEQEVIETRLIISAILDHIGGLQLNSKREAFVDDYEARGRKLWKNRDRRKASEAEIESGGNPNMDAGWEDPDA